MASSDQITELDQREISLLYIVNFLKDSWKKLAIAAIAGGILGFVNWNFLVSYQAEYVLLNDNYAFDLVSWKTLQKTLPNLAAQIEDEGKAPDGQGSLYKALENEQWWQKNVIPIYALSKAETKDLAAIGKDLDLSSTTTILGLTIRADGSSKEKSIENVRAAAKFLRTGSAYLQLRNILNSYETETTSTVADLQNRITTTEIEMGYQVQRSKSLEELYKRFPGGNNSSNQVFDPKDSSAKYLPIATQIIAVDADINLSKETLQRYKDRLTKITQLKIFLDEAMPLTEKIFDGIVLGDELLVVETKMRAKISKDDIKQQEVLDQLRAQLLSVKNRFTKNLGANTVPKSTKKGMIKSTAGGMAVAFSLIFLVLLGQRVRQTVTSGGAK